VRLLRQLGSMGWAQRMHGEEAVGSTACARTDATCRTLPTHSHQPDCPPTLYSARRSLSLMCRVGNGPPEQRLPGPGTAIPDPDMTLPEMVAGGKPRPSDSVLAQRCAGELALLVVLCGLPGGVASAGPGLDAGHPPSRVSVCKHLAAAPAVPSQPTWLLGLLCNTHLLTHPLAVNPAHTCHPPACSPILCRGGPAAAAVAGPSCGSLGG